MSKKELAEKLGFDFDEVKGILSEDTLKSMEKLNTIKGGIQGGCAPTFNSQCFCTPDPPPLQLVCDLQCACIPPLPQDQFC